MSKIKAYRISDEGYLIITSDSGSTYKLTPKTCNCVGFGFRKTCSHLKEAEERGLLKLMERKNKGRFPSLRSPMIVANRKDAIRQYLTKHKIKFTETLVNKVEPLLTYEMSITQFLKIIKKG